MTLSNQTQSLVDAVCAILGAAAPAPGMPRYQKLFVDAGPMLASARTDYPSYLSATTRDALLEALGNERVSATGFVHEVVRDGYHGAAFASDDELLTMCAELSIEEVLSAADATAAGECLPGAIAGAEAVPARAGVLLDLRSPEAVEIVASMRYGTEWDELPTSLSAALDSSGLPNPYATLFDLPCDAAADTP